MRNVQDFWQRQLIYSILISSLFGGLVSGQDASVRPPQPGRLQGDATNAGQTAPAGEQKRLFGIIPNYRTSSNRLSYAPLTTRQKFEIAKQDTFDRGTFILAAAFGAEAQVANSNPSFGSGASAYGRYFATSYADYAIGDVMTEGIFPTLFHQDPRYFRKGQGNGLSRVGYSIAQLFWTRTDSQTRAFNVSEVGGNAMAVAISQAYYPDTRDASDAVSKLGTQIGVDMASNILKEFSPDIYRLFGRKKTHNP